MMKTIEELLQCPYWIIDILPSQVPQNSPGQYFAVEKYFLQWDRLEEIKQKHINLILKLNCYIQKRRTAQLQWIQSCQRNGGCTEEILEGGRQVPSGVSIS